jgi:hypothetical protein
LAVILRSLTATHARASLVIDLSVSIGGFMAPGGTETMDISVTSTTVTDELSSFGLALQIQGAHSPTSVLQFTTNQSDPYTNHLAQLRPILF